MLYALYNAHAHAHTVTRDSLRKCVATRESTGSLVSRLPSAHASTTLIRRDALETRDSRRARDRSGERRRQARAVRKRLQQEASIR